MPLWVKLEMSKTVFKSCPRNQRYLTQIPARQARGFVVRAHRQNRGQVADKLEVEASFTLARCRPDQGDPPRWAGLASAHGIIGRLGGWTIVTNGSPRGLVQVFELPPG